MKAKLLKDNSMTSIHKKFHFASFSSIIICFAMFLHSCVEEYNPQINEEQDVIVVDGTIFKEDTIQYIKISRSAPYTNPEFRPETRCIVKVVDDLGNEFIFNEIKEGVYASKISSENLIENRKFKLQFKTYSGINYESDFEKMPKNVPIDTIYYKKELNYSSTTNAEIIGLQYYIDINAHDNEVRNFRWLLTETWEYHSKYKINGYLDQNQLYLISNSDSLFYCWKTAKANGLYSANTKNLIKNEKKKIPLNFVSNLTNRLSVRYSLFVKQYSLSDNAYEYWNQKKTETQEAGGLYTSQPSISKSNIVNITNPDEVVLGFFWVSSYTTKRIFYKGPPNFALVTNNCKTDTITQEDMNENLDQKYLYLMDPLSMMWVSTFVDCFDCRLHGGDTLKPDFW